MPGGTSTTAASQPLRRIRRQSTARRSSRATPAVPSSRETRSVAATTGQTQMNELTGRSAVSWRRVTAPSSHSGVERASTSRKNRSGDRALRPRAGRPR
jgi:hypothetical protein